MGGSHLDSHGALPNLALVHSPGGYARRFIKPLLNPAIVWFLSFGTFARVQGAAQASAAMRTRLQMSCAHHWGKAKGASSGINGYKYFSGAKMVRRSTASRFWSLGQVVSRAVHSFSLEYHGNSLSASQTVMQTLSRLFIG